MSDHPTALDASPAPSKSEARPPARGMSRWLGRAATALKAKARDRRAAFVLDACVWLACLPALAWCIRALSLGWSHTIVDHHAFRQTQTAISVFWMLRGRGWLAYETPVLGFPWALPFEFPIYQWCVALVAKVGPWALDQAGRAVSVAGFVGCMAFLWRVLAHLKLRATERVLVLLLFVLSPTHLFWSRTFMIESTALCASLWFLERTLAFTRRDSPLQGWMLTTWTAAGVLAALIKSTTFLSFAVGAAGCLTIAIVSACRRRDWASAKRAVLAGGLVFGASFICLKGWVIYSDHLKRANPLARDFLTTEALHEWLMGTWAQKTTLATWEIWFKHRIDCYVGSQWVLFVFLLVPFLIEGWLGLLTFAVFTNLHVVHDYYQFSNTIFLTSALGFLLVGLLRRPRFPEKLAAVAMTLVVGYTMIGTYRERYFALQTVNNNALDELVNLIKAHTAENDVIFIVGADWSPATPYYAGRRAVMDRNSRAMNDPVMQEELGLLRRHGYRIGALLSCSGERGSPRTAERLSALDVPVLRGTGVLGCDVFTR